VIVHYEYLTTHFREDRPTRCLQVVSYLELVRLLRERGRDGEAADVYRKAATLDPANPAVCNELAWFLATDPSSSREDAAEAVRFAKKAVDGERGSADYWNTLGVAHYRNGEYRDAIVALKTAMGMRKGGHSFDWFFLAMSLWSEGDRDEARAWFKRAVEWMDENMPTNEELRRFRDEAERLLELGD
jgi:Flp pilus assembly protein TadD